MKYHENTKKLILQNELLKKCTYNMDTESIYSLPKLKDMQVKWDMIKLLIYKSFFYVYVIVYR